MPRIPPATRDNIIAAYTDIKFPGAFGGLNRFAKNLRKEKNIKVNIKVHFFFISKIFMK